MTIYRSIPGLALLAFLHAGVAVAQAPSTPVPGQPGKDVVWVPTPDDLVEQMLDLAKVTPKDFVMDLGSGDGRNIIAAARRGAWGMGIEFNPDLVLLSKKNAAIAGVYDQAQFVEGDMFEADFSEANVLVLFLLPDNLLKLRPKFLEMHPGSRIVSNTFGIQGWTADQTEDVPNCTTWCSVLLWIVPAKVGGTWHTSNGLLTLKQDFQMISGTLGSTRVTGKLNGDQIVLTGGGTEYTGKVVGTRIEGDGWTATR